MLQRHTYSHLPQKLSLWCPVNWESKLMGPLGSKTFSLLISLPQSVAWFALQSFDHRPFSSISGQWAGLVGPPFKIRLPLFLLSFPCTHLNRGLCSPDPGRIQWPSDNIMSAPWCGRQDSQLTLQWPKRSLTPSYGLGEGSGISPLGNRWPPGAEGARRTASIETEPSSYHCKELNSVQPPSLGEFPQTPDETQSPGNMKTMRL